MARYLNSADALHTLKHIAYETALKQHDPYVADVFKDIAKNRLETWVGLIPTADVPERNVGKWIEYNYPGAECVYCSNCKEEYYPDDLLLGGNDYPNYCPHCGADMRERREDAVH